MSASYDLFCRWKYVQKIDSDNAGAIALGVSRGTVSLWKQGKNAEIQLIEKMAGDIGERQDLWAARVMAERSSSEEERGAWKRIAQRLGTTATFLAVIVFPALSARAEAVSGWVQSEPVVCIMRNSIPNGTGHACVLPPAQLLRGLRMQELPSPNASVTWSSATTRRSMVAGLAGAWLGPCFRS